MDAQLVAQPMAAAIGAGLPIHEPLGNMIVDIGGGTSETAMISLGGIVALEAIRIGSFDIDASIQAFVRREYGMAIGERTAEEIRDAIDENVRAICESVVKCLGHAPPELAQDLIRQGIHLVGGGAMLRGFDQRLADETELPVHLVDAPLECVVLGAGKCLEAFESLKVLFMGAER